MSGPVGRHGRLPLPRHLHVRWNPEPNGSDANDWEPNGSDAKDWEPNGSDANGCCSDVNGSDPNDGEPNDD